MFCPFCGEEVPTGSRTCASCGQTAPAGGLRTDPVATPDGAEPANYLIQAIVVTLCCCLPFGIVAIVYAARVNPKIQAGDLAGARSDSKSALTWIWLSAIFGFIIQVLFLLIGLQGNL